MNKNLIETEKESCEAFIVETERIMDNESLTIREKSEVIQQRLMTLQRLKVLNILLREEQ
jgi:hypothetical protein